MSEPLIFVSYSHKDEKEKEELLSQLGVLHNAGIAAWCDDNIAGGGDWEKAIRDAMADARIAILLISASYLTSEFILNEEVPFLLERRKKEDLIIFPIIAKPCAWKEVHWVSQLNLRPKNGMPVWGGSANRRQAEQELAGIASEISGLLKGSPQSKPDPDPIEQRSTTFLTHINNPHTFFVDDRNCFWLSDGHEVKVFQINRPDPIGRWPLARKRFKRFLPKAWNQNFVASDWDGNIYTIGDTNQRGFKLFHKARYDATPIHLMTTGLGSELIAAAYDGRILGWDKKGNPLWNEKTVQVRHLPRIILPLFGGPIVVLDQSGRLQCFDRKGDIIWSSVLEPRLIDIWAMEKESGQGEICGVTDKGEIVCFDPKTEALTSLDRLSAPMTCISHNTVEHGDPCSVIACQGGNIEWFSWSAKRLLESSRVGLEHEVKVVIAVYDKEKPYTHIALALLDDGQVITLNDSTVSYISRNVHCLDVDKSGRFVFQAMERTVEVMRNPGVQLSPCKITLIDQSGSLVVGGYKQIVIHLKNSGSIPIGFLRAALSGNEVTVSGSQEVKETIPPEKEITLRFSVKALAIGDAVPLTLKIEMQDDLGPPIWDVNIPLEVMSEKMV